MADDIPFRIPEDDPQVLVKRQDSFISTIATTLYSDLPFDTLIRTELTVYGTFGNTYVFTSGSSAYTTIYTYVTSTGWGPYKPLTTVFTPPADCLNGLHAENWDIASATASYPYFHLPNGDRIDCFPYDYFVVDYPFYSPGICPSGYALVSYNVTTSTGTSNLATVTRGDCCPSGFTANGGTTCYSYIDGNPSPSSGFSSATTAVSYGTHTITFSYLPTITTTSDSLLTVVTDTSPSTGLVVVTHGAEIDARNIEIMWQSTDQVVVNWFSNITAPGPTPGPTTSAPSKHTVSPGAIAGIVVGSIAFLAFIVLGVCLFLWRRKSRRAVESDTYHYNAESALASPQFNVAVAAPVSKEKAELDSRDVSPTLVSTNSLSPPTSFPPPQFPYAGNTSELPGAGGTLHPLGIYQPSTPQNPGYPVGLPVHPPGSMPLESDLAPPGAGLPPPNFVSDGSVNAQVADQSFVPQPMLSTHSSTSELSDQRLQALREQQTRVREEMARLARLQELAVMDAHLERQLSG